MSFPKSVRDLRKAVRARSSPAAELLWRSRRTWRKCQPSSTNGDKRRNRCCLVAVVLRRRCSCTQNKRRTRASTGLYCTLVQTPTQRSIGKPSRHLPEQPQLRKLRLRPALHVAGPDTVWSTHISFTLTICDRVFYSSITILEPGQAAARSSARWQRNLRHKFGQR